MRKVTLYTKPDCSLCDEARAVLGRWSVRRAFELEEIDISHDTRLLERYRERIPVVAVDGAETFDYVIDEAALARLLGAPERVV